MFLCYVRTPSWLGPIFSPGVQHPLLCLDGHKAPNCTQVAPPWVLWLLSGSHYSLMVVPVRWSADSLTWRPILLPICPLQSPGLLSSVHLASWLRQSLRLLWPPALACHLPWPESPSPFHGYTLPHRMPSSKASMVLLGCLLIPKKHSVLVSLIFRSPHTTDWCSCLLGIWKLCVPTHPHNNTQSMCS